jgi:aminopeptidase
MTPDMAFDFEQQLDQYADLAIRVGVNVQPGQRLLIYAPVAAAPFVRRLVEHGYRAGSRLVDVQWSDEEVERARYRHAPDGSFEEVASWRYDARIEAARRGDALLTVLADDPGAFEGLDADRIATTLRARLRALRPYSELTRRDAAPWALIGVPVFAWAQAVFPDIPADEAMADLWGAVLGVVRCDRPGAISRWQTPMGTSGRAAPRIPPKGPRSSPTFRPKRSTPRPTATGSTELSRAPSRWRATVRSSRTSLLRS